MAAAKQGGERQRSRSDVEGPGLSAARQGKPQWVWRRGDRTLWSLGRDMSAGGQQETVTMAKP